YDLTTSMEHFDDLFEGYRDETIYYNMPGQFIPNLQDPAIIRQLKAQEITFVVGEKDVFLENNRAISNALWSKAIWNALHIWDGESHKARYWLYMVQLYLYPPPLAHPHSRYFFRTSTVHVPPLPILNTLAKFP